MLKRSSPAPGVGRVRNYAWTLGLGAVLATAFITFAPSALSPESIGQSFAGVLNPTPNGLSIAGFKYPIGILAGHTGNDFGAVCDDGLTEVSVNEDTALRVKSILEQQGYVVDLLAEFDPRLKGYKAAALVSIHADTCEFIDENATGFKVAGSQAGTAADASQHLTQCIVERYAARTGLPNHSGSITWDMTGYHAFNEVDPSTPVAIIETGFLYLDRTFLTQHADLVAQGIADGILRFLRNEEVGGTATPTL